MSRLIPNEYNIKGPLQITQDDLIELNDVSDKIVEILTDLYIEKAKENCAAKSEEFNEKQFRNMINNLDLITKKASIIIRTPSNSKNIIKHYNCLKDILRDSSLTNQIIIELKLRCK